MRCGGCGLKGDGFTRMNAPGDEPGCGGVTQPPPSELAAARFGDMCVLFTPVPLLLAPALLSALLRPRRASVAQLMFCCDGAAQ